MVTFRMMSNSLFRVLIFSEKSLFKTITLSRAYSRNHLWRKPVRILNLPEDNHIPPIHEKGLDARDQLQISKKTDESVVPAKVQTSQKLIIPPYEKLQKNDAKFTKTLTVIKNKKLRMKSGKILLEGKRLINDAIQAGMEMKAIYFSREKDLADIKLKNIENVDICKVLYHTLKVWSDLTTNPGVMAIFKRPSADDLHILSASVLPVTVLCDNIRDPGNLGSIIRNSAAAGCEHVLLTKGCVDPWESKVLRAGCGGHFRIPVVNDIEWSHINNYIAQDSTVFIADCSADINDCSSIPEFVNYSEGMDEIEEDTKYVTIDENNQPTIIDETFNEGTKLEKYEDIALPCHLYSSVKFPQKNIVLYVGGEVQGVDPRAVKLACEYGGVKVKIPLENEIESLNSSFAMTIILYEIKRQFTETYVTR